MKSSTVKNLVLLPDFFPASTPHPAPAHTCILNMAQPQLYFTWEHFHFGRMCECVHVRLGVSRSVSLRVWEAPCGVAALTPVGSFQFFCVNSTDNNPAHQPVLLSSYKCWFGFRNSLLGGLYYRYFGSDVDMFRDQENKRFLKTACLIR